MKENFGITGKVLLDDSPGINPITDWDMLGELILNVEGCELGHEQGSLTDFHNHDDLAVEIPVYYYNHGILSLSTTPYSSTWDSGIAGYIVLTKDKLKEEKLTYTQAKGILKAEVETYSAYLAGHVHGYVIKDADGEVIDSCWGFIGDEEYCKTEMNQALALAIKEEGERLEKMERDYLVDDWKSEVLNGYTVLGLKDWREHKYESDKA